MAKRRTFTTAPPSDADLPTDGDGEGSARVSYRERSGQANEIARLSLLLVAMKPHQLAEIPLTPEVAEAVVQCRDFRKGARARQLRLINKLLRQSDYEAVRTAVTEIVRGRKARSQREKSYEAWRERLLTGGDTELTAFLSQHRGGDAQRMRQLIRLATRDQQSGKSKHASRDLLRMIRELGEAAAPHEAAPEQADSAEADWDEVEFDDVESDEVESDAADSDDVDPDDSREAKP